VLRQRERGAPRAAIDHFAGFQLARVDQHPLGDGDRGRLPSLDQVALGDRARVRAGGRPPQRRDRAHDGPGGQRVQEGHDAVAILVQAQADDPKLGQVSIRGNVALLVGVEESPVELTRRSERRRALEVRARFDVGQAGARAVRGVGCGIRKFWRVGIRKLWRVKPC
jgi:hypothetical protein